MYFNSLSQTNKTVSARFEGIIPNRATTIEAILDNTDFFPGSTKSDFHNTRPALFERQPPTCRGDNAPRQRIGINKNVMHTRLLDVL